MCMIIFLIFWIFFWIFQLVTVTVAFFVGEWYPPVNEHSWLENSPFSIGNTSSIRVHFPVSHVRYLGIFRSFNRPLGRFGKIGLVGGLRPLGCRRRGAAIPFKKKHWLVVEPTHLKNMGQNGIISPGRFFSNKLWEFKVPPPKLPPQ